MLSVSSTHKQKIINELISNKLEIFSSDSKFDVITETNIESESMSLKQSICDENKLKFGGCIASEFKIGLLNTVGRTFDVSKLVGCWILVKLTQTFPSGSPILPSSSLYPSDTLYPGEAVTTKSWCIFNGMIDKAEVNKTDQNKISITAYDVISQLYETDCTNALQKLWNNNSNSTSVYALLAMVSEKFINLCGQPDAHFLSDRLLNEVINKVENLTVKNMKIFNKVWLDDSEKVNYGQLLNYTAEMLGVFAFVKPDNRKGGNIVFVNLETDTTKAEKYDFYEAFNADEKSSGTYGTVDFAIRGSTRTAKVRSYKFLSGKTYDMTDNILVWQENDNAGGAWIHKFENLFSGDTGKRIHHKIYKPIEATLDGRLWVEPGDMVQIKYYVTDADGNYAYNADGTPQTATVTSYVLSRELTGIQALTDKITAKGE